MEVKEYEKVFLTDCSFEDKSQIYINKENYENIKNILPLMATGISHEAYINNIISKHLEDNNKVIRVLTESKFKKIIKSCKSSQ